MDLPFVCKTCASSLQKSYQFGQIFFTYLEDHHMVLVTTIYIRNFAAVFTDLGSGPQTKNFCLKKSV